MPSSGGGGGGGGGSVGAAPPSPLGYNIARRKPRQRWAGGCAGLPPGVLPSSLSALVVRVGPSARPRSGRASISSASLPGSSVMPSRGLSVGSRRRGAPAGRVWMPGLAAVSSQAPPLPSVRPVAARRRWRSGRSVFLGLPAAVVPTPPLTPIIAARPPHRGRPGSSSASRSAAGIAPPPSRPLGATLAPVSRRGNSRPAGRAWFPRLVRPVLQTSVLPGATAVRRRGDEMARRRPGWLVRCRPVGLVFDGKLHYNIYINSGTGDPIDYSTQVVSLLATTWTSSGLAAPGTWSFGVRAENINGEEKNLDCAVSIVLDAFGNDITDRPDPPMGLRAVPLAGASIRVEWSYPPTRGAKAPVGFRVYLGAGGAPDYSAPAA